MVTPPELPANARGAEIRDRMQVEVAISYEHANSGLASWRVAVFHRPEGRRDWPSPRSIPSYDEWYLETRELNAVYRNLIVERVRCALESAKSATDLEHAGVKGALREALIADLFRPLLPTDIGLATGILISSENQQSAQQDIVIFDRRVLPPLLFQGPALIPVESALATIEVKSCLSATELKRAQANALSIRALSMLSGHRDEHGKYVDPIILDDSGNTVRGFSHQASAPSPYVFALDSDLSTTGKTELERHAEVCGDDPHVLRGICVVGRGCFVPTQRVVFDRPSGKYRTFNFEPLRNSWEKVVDADHEHGEVVALIGAIHNLVMRVSARRGLPPLSAYLG
jgi:hypothetical protein